MSQFIKTNTDDNELSVLVSINKRNNENYMSVIIANIIDIESLEDRLVILTNSKGMNFELNKERCLKNNCEYKISMPQELIDKLIEEDKFIIGIKNIKNNYAIGLLVNLMGFQEMYKLL
jgi:invasion protein IalB